MEKTLTDVDEVNGPNVSLQLSGPPAMENSDDPGGVVDQDDHSLTPKNPDNDGFEVAAKPVTTSVCFAPENDTSTTDKGSSEVKKPKTSKDKGSGTNHQEQRVQPVERFKTIMRFVSKPSIRLEPYFNRAVLPFIIDTNKHLAAHILPLNHKSSTMDDTLALIVQYGGVRSLQNIGYDMIESVFRASSQKYGQRVIQETIQKALDKYNQGSKTFADCYNELFLSETNTLERLLRTIKTSITRLG
jgi:hypothetical protein